ncbi:Fe-S protein assembly co-chaperone HscB [Acinetobacter qingfengensis]|uniref:Co-chaperone protein HscB homolog n=1 Tax=Acinetobacter qingfengensis TaxID=1262585 RepID=A0A1E7R9E1_9GAMM|nr:Fe-S protein assembly co-chaperone HscB [Acinetobacter qingfengensis]KAA8735450.1 Fe-S protein assembly co-chaperone HscB [Acinetobacter qingfengensis]OEY95905.1 Fe-S protein assembly co-chaperone HscB [Acinetobacter qingfengensis]
MTYFDLFDLEPSLDLDLDALKTKFLALQQQYHPDHNQDNIEQAVTESSEINQAYTMLKQIDSRAAYLLKLQKQDAGLEQSIHDFEFLQSALDMREQLDEANTVEQLQQLREEIQQWVDSLIREFKLDFSAQDWSEARDTVRKLRFFRHVLADIDKAEDKLFDDDQFSTLDDDF